MSDDIRLDLLRDAIADSGLDGQTKDALADDLRYAQEINGTDDPSLRGIKRLIISGIRRELLAHDRMEKAIKRVLEDTREGLYRHDGHELVTRHVHSAVLAKNRGGWLTLAKEKDSMKIDAAVTFTFGYDVLPLARIAADNSGADVYFAFS